MRPDPVHVEDQARTAFQHYVVPEIEVLLRVATSITRDPVDAEDLVQETLLRAYRGIAGFDGRYPRAWLLTIMRNAQRNRVRRQRPGLLRDPDLTSSQQPDPSWHAGDVGEIVAEPMLDAVIEQAFNALPDKFRQVVAFVDIDGLSYAEAATAIGIPLGTVMSRLHRGRKRIRVRLEAAGVTTSRGGA